MYLYYPRHTFCSTCLNIWTEESKKVNKNCPICRKKIDFKEISFDLMAYNLIGEIEVHCNNMENGCMWEGTIAELATHLEDCVYPTTKMPKWLKEHLKSLKKSKGAELSAHKDKKIKYEDEYVESEIVIPMIKAQYPARKKTFDKKPKKVKKRKRVRHSQP